MHDYSVATAAPATETTESTTTTTTNPTAPAKSRSFFGPLLLILVGVGVLVMLWRASS